MYKKIAFVIFLFAGLCSGKAQEKSQNPRPLTMAEYDVAKNYSIADLDKDTYVKFNNTYILDRYQSRKPFFITGDDGLKKRIDLYRLVAKEGMQEIGLMVFYTNEKGKVYKALVPDYSADGKVWEKYFQDIDNINKEEKNFVLKLSYILSRELSFQQYKVLNNGKTPSEEEATYGSDICFPGDEEVALAGGLTKMLRDVKAGDEVVTVDPQTKTASVVKVKELTIHEAKNYALTGVVLIAATHKKSHNGTNIHLSTKVVQATPNHPMITKGAKVKMADLRVGEKVLCLNQRTGKYDAYEVWEKDERAGGVQKVYNMIAEGGSTFIMNGVMVMQK